MKAQHLDHLQLWLSGEEFLVWCNGIYELQGSRDDAQKAATKLAHLHQADAFILAPIMKVAPKRDVEISEISL